MLSQNALVFLILVMTREPKAQTNSLRNLCIILPPTFTNPIVKQVQKPSDLCHNIRFQFHLIFQFQMKILSPILPIIEQIIGNLDELRAQGKITDQQIDYVPLQWFESERNILRKTTQSGREIAFRLLKEGQRLKHNDVVLISDDQVIAIEILPSDVIVLSPQTLPEMARACYEIGNKHSPLFLDGNEVTLPYDKPMFEWLQAAGFAPKQEQRRLSQALRANSAQGHGHSHSHSHSHSHDGYHQHGDGHWHKH